MVRFTVVLIILIFSSFFSGTITAQTVSSYSALGIGDLYLPAQAHNQGMGGIGISNSSVFYQGALNPALLADNALYAFAAGFNAENKTISQNDISESAGGGTLSYLSMLLPVYRGKVAMSFGLSPYTSVNYNFKSESTVEGKPEAEMLLFNKGTGGFNQFTFSTGLKLTRSFYVGGKIGYVFSSINRERNNFLSNPSGVYVPTSVTKLTANDFLFTVGGVYRHYFSEELHASIGAVYDFQNDIRVTRSQFLQIKSTTNTLIKVDTIDNKADGYLHLPNSMGFGFSVSKLNQWTFGSDIRFQYWSDYVNFDGNNENLVDSRLIRIGGEFTPDISSVDNYLARVTYRVGLNIDQTPYYIDGTQIDEFGINFGLSLPVSNFSSVDMGFRFGSRGTTDNNLIEENFFRIYFGVTFNDNRWFVRPKFN